MCDCEKTKCICSDLQLRKRFRRSQNLLTESSSESDSVSTVHYEDPGNVKLPESIFLNKRCFPNVMEYFEYDKEKGFEDINDYKSDESENSAGEETKTSKKKKGKLDNYEMFEVSSRKLSNLLEEVRTFGNFATANIIKSFPQPGIEVGEEKAVISLPLDSTGLQVLKGVCEIAPFGKGEETVVDTTFRNCWQVGPEGFQITSPHWQEFLVSLLPNLKRDLGIEAGCKVELDLYKLLAYENGCFFKAHKDSEKCERMIGTLVMVLPSIYAGGELIIRHQGEEKVFDFSKFSRNYIQYAAFYADCVHEVKPVTSGSRICLVYNILMKDRSGEKPSLPSTEEISKLAKAVSKMQKLATEDYDAFYYILSHEYTKQSLCVDFLKRDDWAIAKSLKAALQSIPGCRLYLGHLEIKAKKELDEGSRGNYDECDVELINVTDLGGKPVPKPWPFNCEGNYYEIYYHPKGKLEKCKFRENWDGDFGNSSVFKEQFYHITVLILSLLEAEP